MFDRRVTEEFIETREIAIITPVIPKRQRKIPELVTVALPFYQATGFEINDRVTMWSLQCWEAVRFRRFRDGKIPHLPQDDNVYDPRYLDLVPHSLFRFMYGRTFTERDKMERAFAAAMGAGLKDAGAVRNASEGELKRFGKNIGFFLANGLGRIIEGTIISEPISVLVRPN